MLKMWPTLNSLNAMRHHMSVWATWYICLTHTHTCVQIGWECLLIARAVNANQYALFNAAPIPLRYWRNGIENNCRSAIANKDLEQIVTTQVFHSDVYEQCLCFDLDFWRQINKLINWKKFNLILSTWSILIIMMDE